MHPKKTPPLESPYCVAVSIIYRKSAILTDMKQKDKEYKLETLTLPTFVTATSRDISRDNISHTPAVRLGWVITVLFRVETL